MPVDRGLGLWVPTFLCLPPFAQADNTGFSPPPLSGGIGSKHQCASVFMCSCIQLWGFGVSYRTSDVAPVVATTIPVLALIPVAAIVVFGFIAVPLLAALVLGFIAVTAYAAAAAVAVSALVTAAAPAAFDTTTGLEVQVDAPGAAGCC